MSTLQGQPVVDGDGHVVEDHEAIWERMPQDYRVGNWSMRSPFAPNDLLHAANRHFVPEGAFAKVGPEGWLEFLEDVGVESTVLYPSNGLAFGRVVSADWAIELARAYNDCIHDEYVGRSPRFRLTEAAPTQRKISGSPARSAVTMLGRAAPRSLRWDD